MNNRNPGHGVMHDPVAIGGIGGSGTRLIASLLRHAGVHLGDDLNASEDCLWFTLLFKRLDILDCSDEEFDLATAVLVAGLTGGRALTVAMKTLTQRLAQHDRPQHSADWLSERVTSLMHAAAAPPTSRCWGWKEPNTHIVIERLWRRLPTLRYVHVVRNGVDMAFSENQNQLELWGPTVLQEGGALTPSRSLSYWCRVHRRMQSLLVRHPRRMYWLDYDAFCADPDPAIADLCRFLGHDPQRAAVLKYLVRPQPRRHASADLRCFDGQDLAYVRSLGYRV